MVIALPSCRSPGRRQAAASALSSGEAVPHPQVAAGTVGTDALVFAGDSEPLLRPRRYSPVALSATPATIHIIVAAPCGNTAGIKSFRNLVERPPQARTDPTVQPTVAVVTVA